MSSLRQLEALGKGEEGKLRIENQRLAARYFGQTSLRIIYDYDFCRLAELEAKLESKEGSKTSGVKSGKSAAEKVKDSLILNVHQ